MIETEVYKIPTSSYGRTIAMRWIGRYWWCLALPLVLSLFAGLSDWRWWIVGLAVLFVLYPGILLLAYYYHALSPDVVRNILPQKVIVDQDLFTIIYYPLIEDGKAPAPLSFSRQDIAQCYPNGNYIHIILKNNMIIDLPCYAFPKASIYDIFPQLMHQP